MAPHPPLSQIAGNHLELFEAYFQQEDKAKNNAIGALDAANFLKKSGLSDSILSRIWDLSDPTGRGFLDKQGFFIALKLVSLAQNDREINMAGITVAAPPPKMGDPPKLPVQPDWDIKLSDRLKFEQLFESLGPVNGRLPGNKVKPVMLNSKLPVDTLGQVWDLSDMDKDGLLDRDEFILAMHIIYQALENHPVPVTLPPNLVPPSKRERKLLPGAVQVLPILSSTSDSNWAAFSSVPENDDMVEKLPVEVPWVVSALDKTRYDVMFKAADLDNDGYVNGVEIKDLFLQSGLPQQTLAHIWNLCDIKQTGKLNTEQFALAMYLVQKKLQGGDLPSALTPEMTPPSLRQKATPDNDEVSGDTTTTYNNPELDMITKEINELLSEKKQLEKDVSQKDTEISTKKLDLQTLQTELETLSAAVKQLDTQKGEAQKRLDDLDAQKSSLDLSMYEVRKQLEEESDEVDKLKKQAEEQEKLISDQEKELNAKRQELNDLRLEESKLEQQIESGRNQLNALSKSMQESQTQITKAKNKLLQMEDQQTKLNEVITQYESAISSGNVWTIGDGSLKIITPVLSETDIADIATSLPASGDLVVSNVDDFHEDPFKREDPFSNTNGFGHDPFSDEDPFKSEDPFGNANSESHVGDPFGGSDPFAESFGQNATNDPFASFHAQPASSGKTDPFDPFGLSSSNNNGNLKNAENFSNGDQFGGDPFAPPPVASRSESPTPALPPKKSKQPPPRPAPPKSSGVRAPRMAPPAPDPFSNDDTTTTKRENSGFGNDQLDPFSNSTNSTKDPFGGSATNSDQFADFANFDKCVSGGGVWGISEDDQLEWATTDSLRMEHERRKEDADLELALALSRKDATEC